MIKILRKSTYEMLMLANASLELTLGARTSEVAMLRQQLATQTNRAKEVYAQALDFARKSDGFRAQLQEAQGRLTILVDELKEARAALESTGTDCRSEEGVTVGLVDALIVISRVLKGRDFGPLEVQEALADLDDDEDVRAIVDAAASAQRAEF